MTDIGGLIQQEYNNLSSHLFDECCQEIRTCGSPGEFLDKCYDKIKRAMKIGEVNLSLIVDIGLQRLTITNDEISGYIGYEILKKARELGAAIDVEKVLELTYESVVNHGTTKLRVAEQVLELTLDPNRVAEEAYRLLEEHCPDHFYSPRAIEALAYTVEKGTGVDQARMPSQEQFERVVQMLLTSHHPSGHRKALQCLQNLEKIGVQAASKDSIAKLAQLVECER